VRTGRWRILHRDGHTGLDRSGLRSVQHGLHQGRDHLLQLVPGRGQPGREAGRRLVPLARDAAFGQRHQQPVAPGLQSELEDAMDATRPGIMGKAECSSRLREHLTVLCQRLQQACAVLCNPEQRRVYDRDTGQTTTRVEDLVVHGPATFEDEEPTVAELLSPLQHQWRRCQYRNRRWRLDPAGTRKTSGPPRSAPCACWAA